MTVFLFIDIALLLPFKLLKFCIISAQAQTSSECPHEGSSPGMGLQYEWSICGRIFFIFHLYLSHIFKS